MNPQDDRDTGEFSNVGRDGWDWRSTLWVAGMTVLGYGLVALIALAVKAIWGG